MMKIALVSGSWPPEACGVGDYSAKLADALVACNIEVSKVGGSALSATKLLLPRFVNDHNIIHVQYPTMGYGRSFCPALIPILNRKRKTVVTIHEFSNFKTIRRPWFISFAHAVDARVFTNYHEMKSFEDAMHPTSGKSYVVPIASNIGRGNDKKINGSVCNFGLLTPNKGIEDFISLAINCRGLKPFSFSLIGATTDMYKVYADSIISRCKKEGISVHLNLMENDLADLLSTFQFAYLPFPDGASPKRGTLLAAQQNSIVVITNHTALTTDGLKESTVAAKSPDDAKTALIRLVTNLDNYEHALRQVAASEFPNWRDVANRHMSIYESLL